MNIREHVFRAWYWYVNKKDKHADVLFMNYGYTDSAENVTLSPEDEKNRYSIQLYRYLAKDVDLEDKDIIEIGCGRGGGLSYINRNYAPKTAVGVDLNAHAIRFCDSYYEQPSMSFRNGDALDIPAEDRSCDVVFNVESSHRYLDMPRFLCEAQRILRPGGYLLLTDFRYAHEMDRLKDDINRSGMNIIGEEDITDNVVHALEADTGRRSELVRKLAPRMIRKTALNFAGAVGSPTYTRFVNREYIYFAYRFQKRS